MLQMVARQWEHILFLLTSPKCFFGEVEKGMLQGLVCHIKLIFGLLTIPKCELVEVQKALYLGLA